MARGADCHPFPPPFFGRVAVGQTPLNGSWTQGGEGSPPPPVTSSPLLLSAPQPSACKLVHLLVTLGESLDGELFLQNCVWDLKALQNQILAPVCWRCSVLRERESPKPITKFLL